MTEEEEAVETTEEVKKEEIDPAWIPLKPEEEALPTKIDLEASDVLQNFLQKAGTIADQANMDHRFKVMEALSKHVDEFIEKIRVKKGVEPDEGMEKCVGKLFYSGSFKLGVCFPDSDIDTVCVAPHFVQLTDFFTVLYQILQGCKDCQELIKVEEAYVPIMKMKYMGIEIDMSFVQLGVKTIPPDINLGPDSVLANITKVSVRALNSLRVNNMVLKLVPNLENFKVLLRFVRCWSSNRGLYGNVFGYFGGVNLTILSAFVCERHPNASPAMLVFHFFNEIPAWNWPKPLYINTPNTGELPSWDPVVDHYDVMPIITPAYPSTNSLRSATKSSHARIMKEMNRCKEIVTDALVGNIGWDTLCEKSDFFSSYKYYIKIEISANDLTSYNWWKGAVVSKVKFLIISLEQVKYIKCAPIYPSSHTRNENQSLVGTLFIGIESETPPEGEKIEITGPVKKFLEEAYKITDRPLSSLIDAKVIKKNDIPDYAFPEGKKPKKKHSKKKRKTNKPKNSEN